MPDIQLYHPQLPPFLRALAATAPMLRLRWVGMNCGCEYTAFPQFAGCGVYNRYLHSLGVGAIVWHFTGDAAQAAAGLLHDISTPVFAHVVDFLHGDHLRQESTEALTHACIARSAPLQRVLEQWGLTTAQVDDYHRYPVADNDTPRLSADRLEYTLSNLLYYRFATAQEVADYYRDLTLLSGEDGAPELGFATPQVGCAFALAALRCAHVYVAPADRFAMQSLADLLRYALQEGVLTPDDLYTTEPQVIQKLSAHPATAARWRRFTTYSTIHSAAQRPAQNDTQSAEGEEFGDRLNGEEIENATQRPAQGEWLRVPAKKRYIDPLLADGRRASQASPAFAAALTAFLALRFDDWLSAT